MSENTININTITRKYLTFFQKIVSHHALSQNDQLLQLTELCITLAKKVEHSPNEKDHKNTHILLKACMKTIQEAYMMTVEKKDVPQRITDELNANQEKIKACLDIYSIPTNTQVLTKSAHTKKTDKTSEFIKFLESRRNHQLIAASSDTEREIEEPTTQTIDFKRDIQKILQPGAPMLPKNMGKNILKTTTSTIFLYLFILACISNIWTYAHYHTKIGLLENQIQSLEKTVKAATESQTAPASLPITQSEWGHEKTNQKQ